ncbi:MAG: AzlD domain-containing protein [Spirochaetaceae bacterium]|nr:AzlD domain-containing protein [Spirochaetaceae bacterium]
MLSLEKALVASVVMALIVAGCRALPFLFFSVRKPPAMFSFIQDYMPALAMTVLAVSSYTSLDWSAPSHGIPELLAGAVVVLLHLKKRNVLLSIIGGTAFYMLLRHFGPA